MELSHRTLSKSGRYRELSLEGLPPSVPLCLYRQMLRLRRMEEALLAEYHPAEQMRCPIHFCIGQEAIPAALSQLIKADDYLFSHHRSHGYYFAKGAPLNELFAEIYGRLTGADGGKAGSQDISHAATRFFSGAILAGAVGIAVGSALGIRLQGGSQIAVSGFGEGATDEGAFWEAMNFSGKRRLPVLFLVENNRYATFSDQLKRQADDNICERVRTFGVRGTKIFGNDAALAYRTLASEIGKLRSGDGPALVEAYTYRWNSHVGPENDGANNYREPGEMEFWKMNCPVALLGERLMEGALLDEAQKAALESEIAQEIAAHFKFAKESPFPTDTNWRRMNFDDSSPMAERLLGSASRGDFDHGQAEAKLGPY